MSSPAPYLIIYRNTRRSRLKPAECNENSSKTVRPNNLGVPYLADSGNGGSYMGVLIPQARMTHQEFLASKS